MIPFEIILAGLKNIYAPLSFKTVGISPTWVLSFRPPLKGSKTKARPSESGWADECLVFQLKSVYLNCSRYSSTSCNACAWVAMLVLESSSDFSLPFILWLSLLFGPSWVLSSLWLRQSPARVLKLKAQAQPKVGSMSTPSLTYWKSQSHYQFIIWISSPTWGLSNLLFC